MNTTLRRHGDRERGFGPFITWVTHERADGHSLLRTSRRHRKGLPPLIIASPDTDPRIAVRALNHDWFRFWAPRRIGWWIAILFMIGAALFAIGGAQGTWPDSPAVRWLDPSLTGWIFFVGSLYFTAAAYLQWLEVLNNDVTESDSSAGAKPRGWRFFGWRPRNLGFLAAAFQLVGTVFFNINTADALIADLDWVGQDILIWKPNMAGSICFLLASHAALMEISHRYFSFQPGNLSWWIAAINMLGSIFFMLSAMASFVLPGEIVSAPWLANFGTFAGAVCFFIGAYLLIPELFETLPSPLEAEATA